MEAMKPFVITVGDVTRELPTVEVGAMGRVPLIEFIGDVELTRAAAQAMQPLIPAGTEQFLSVVTNSVPLAHEVSDLSGIPYDVVRKKRRTYMKQPLIQDVPSMTLGVAETLWLDGRHAEALKGKNVTVLVDVIASGGTVQALSRLVERAGGTVHGYLAAFVKPQAVRALEASGHRVSFLQPLPGSEATPAGQS